MIILYYCTTNKIWRAVLNGNKNPYSSAITEKLGLSSEFLVFFLPFCTGYRYST